MTTDIEELRATLTLLQRAHVAPATERGYAHDWRKFSRWCEGMSLAAMPATPDTLSLFIADELLHQKKIVTISRYVAGIAYHHRRAGVTSPVTQEIKDLLAGARRLNPELPRQMLPLTLHQVRLIADSIGDRTAVAVRNRAIVMIGFASALRRWNLSALDLDDISFRAEGLIIQVRQEKQDQQGHGRLIAIPFGCDGVHCPVRCLQVWLQIRGREEGPLFTRLDPGRGHQARLSLNAIGDIVKGVVEHAGIDSSEYCAHSLRSGLITEAGIANCNHLAIAAQSGHRSLDSLKRYFRPLDLFRANVCAAIGL